MSDIKVYIGCCKTDFYLLKSCVASIRYWNKEVPVSLLKDFSRGSFDTVELERVFNVGTVPTKYKKLGGYMKLQPYTEHPDERVFLQDADMVWLGDIMQLLNGITEDVVVDAYQPQDIEAELNRWYFNTAKLKKHYPNYKYPGFVFNCGSILLNTKIFTGDDFNHIISWQEGAEPIHPGVFLCEDQGIVNYIVAEKYFNNAISIHKTNLQISSASDEAQRYPIDKIRGNRPKKIIVHWLGKKTGLNSFCESGHLLRFYEKEYYRHVNIGNLKMMLHRLLRTAMHFDQFVYELGKKIYYTFIPRKK